MNDSKWEIIEIIAAFALFFLIVIGVNSCSSSEWNDGTCPKCEVEYELRGVSEGLKYYACPNCGNEVRRY